MGIESNIIPETPSPSCSDPDKLCDLGTLEIELKQTMVLYNGSPKAYPVFEKNGHLYKKINCSSGERLTNEEIKKVNTVDGTYRYVLTINGQYPGPTLVVYEGQEVKVIVKNKLVQEGTSIHWHGFHQLNTNWMDGVAGITMCSINPGESFEYRFKAYPAGTHWYHSHYGLQRIDGLFGALIVLPRSNRDQSFLMLLNDFYPATASFMFSSLYYGMNRYLYFKENTTGCMPGAGKTEDGSEAGVYAFYSALVNGKGQKFSSTGVPAVNVPLEEYTVENDQYYTFRVINAGNAFPLEVSIDGHDLEIISTDNGPITSLTADSLIVNEAERFDFRILTHPITTSKYMIRVKTLEKEHNHYTLAVLTYKGATQFSYNSQKKCSPFFQCRVVNCPFQKRADAVCINTGDLINPNPSLLTHIDREEFLYFDFTESKDGSFRATINGIQFIHPTNAPAVTGKANYDAKCSGCKRGNGLNCECTHQIIVKKNEIVQLILFSTSSSHPIHLHGHTFEVMKIGYPDYDSNNKHVRPSQDIQCGNNDCNKYSYTAEWTDQSWSNGNIPGLNNYPVQKDTVTIPSGGYVVLRFKANNPGWWFMHCHIDVHFAEGMALLVQSGSEEDMIPAPQGMPTCGSFSSSSITLDGTSAILYNIICVIILWTAHALP